MISKKGSGFRIRTSTIVVFLTWSLIVPCLYFFKSGEKGYPLSDLLLLWGLGFLGLLFLNWRDSRLRNLESNGGDNLQISELLYHAIVETSPDSVSVFDLTGKFLFCSKQTAQLHKYDSPEELIGKNAFRLFPIREVLRGARMLRQTRQEGVVQNVEYNLLKKDGTVFPAEFSASLIRDKFGVPFAFLAIVRDITERKWVEAQSRETESLYRIVASNTYDWEFWQAPNDRFLYISPSCKRITGYDDVEFIKDSRLFLDIVHPEDRVSFSIHHQNAGHQKVFSEIEFRIIRRDSSMRWISHVCQPIFDEEGKYLGIRGSNRDITEKKLTEQKLQAAHDQVQIQLKEIEQLHEILREQAIRDALTGLYNRRYLEEALKQEHARAVREGRMVTVVMLDMDYLKKINDEFGHVIGDQALQILGGQLRTMSRIEDVACRYGGDEFLIILHNTARADALKRVEDWRTQLHNMKIQYEDKQLTVTFSAGIASFAAREKSVEQIITAADSALYNAKTMGRNRVLLYDPLHQS